MVGSIVGQPPVFDCKAAGRSKSTMYSGSKKFRSASSSLFTMDQDVDDCVPTLDQEAPVYVDTSMWRVRQWLLCRVCRRRVIQ